MIFVPLPFVAALLLFILLVAMLRAQDSTWRNLPFLILIGLCALQSVVVGLRWGYDIAALRYLLPVLAAGLPPLAYAGFRSLIHTHGPVPAFSGRIGGHIWFAAVAPAIVAALLAVAPGMVDIVLILLFVGYAVALLDLGRSGPDGLDEARLDGALAAHRALIVAAVSLCLSACFDLAIRLDFEWTNGASAALIVANGNLLGLFLIGLTALVASRAQAPAVLLPDRDEEAAHETQDRDILARIDRLLAHDGLFRDENLTLTRLARRAGIPARQISAAVNRLTGGNVSRHINNYRIAEACRLLRDTDMPVTTAMFESGFQTKSNFNREFRRVTSLTPARWRAESGAPTIAEPDRCDQKNLIVMP